MAFIKTCVHVGYIGTSRHPYEHKCLPCYHKVINRGLQWGRVGGGSNSFSNELKGQRLSPETVEIITGLRCVSAGDTALEYQYKRSISLPQLPQSQGRNVSCAGNKLPTGPLKKKKLQLQRYLSFIVTLAGKHAEEHFTLTSQHSQPCLGSQRSPRGPRPQPGVVTRASPRG